MPLQTRTEINPFVNLARMNEVERFLCRLVCRVALLGFLAVAGVTRVPRGVCLQNYQGP